MSSVSAEDIIEVLAHAAVGDTDVRVDVDPDALDDPIDLIANAVNLLLEDLAYRQQEREEALRAAASAEAKREFFAYLSHDMQTPLAILTGYLSLLVEDDLEGEELTDSLRSMRRAARSLERQVNQFLDLARLEAGREIEIQEMPVDVVEVCAEVADLFAADGRVELEITQDDLPSVAADPERVERIVANLVSNALKYSGERSPVTVRLGQQGDDIRVDVVDRGMGMDAEELARVFQKFERGERVADSPGSGLGLFLSRRLARLHGGELTGESVPGEGSRFTLFLPIRGEQGTRA